MTINGATETVVIQNKIIDMIGEGWRLGQNG